MKIIMHNSLKLDIEDVIKAIKGGKALPGTSISMHEGDYVVEPLDLETINLFGEYGPGTDYTLHMWRWSNGSKTIYGKAEGR